MYTSKINFHSKHFDHQTYFQPLVFPPNCFPPKEKWIIVCWHCPTSYYTNQAWTPSEEKWALLQKIKKQEIPAATSTLSGPVRFNGSLRLSLYFVLLFTFSHGDLFSRAKLQYNVVHHKTIWKGRDCSQQQKHPPPFLAVETNSESWT